MSSDLWSEKTGFSKSNSTAPTLPDGAFYEFSLPDKWRNLVIYAHGYVNPHKELALPVDSMAGRSLPGLINELGMAYATTSYRTNGLVGPEAVEDLIQLVNVFIEKHGDPRHIYLVGVSEGALVTTLAVEQHPEIFSGGLAACGPIGNFNEQLNYFGDFHVLFNYFFPGVIDSDPAGVPDHIIEDWLEDNSTLKQNVVTALNRRPDVARELLRTAKVPMQNPSDMEEIVTAVFDLLDFNILATDNAVQRLNGLPYDNSDRVYTGTDSFSGDRELNQNIERFHAEPAALTAIDAEFQTSGDLSRPLITAHTSGDQIIPYWHIPFYQSKVSPSLFHSNITINGRYGHCNFKLSELLTGFGLLIFKASLQDLFVPSSVFQNEREKQEFLNLSREKGISPVIREEAEPVLMED